MNKLLIILIILLFQIGWTQNDMKKAQSGLNFYIGSEVSNADDKNERQIIQLWKDYLLKGKFQDENSPYWSFENMKVPDEYLWAVGVNTLQSRDQIVQCKILGIFKVEHDHYCLVSSFSHVDEEGEIHLDVIPAVYSKKIKGNYKLISGAEYHKSILEHHRVGNINYYVHPFHEFDLEKAKKMSEFNQYMSREFDVEPMEFDYFVANNARDITGIWGYEYMNRMYNPAQQGGVASLRNSLIYAGSNSEFFPHELVHLYAFQSVPKDTHLWIAEGVATFYGGKAGHDLDWHTEKTRSFLRGNPDFDLSNIDVLKEMPNGEHLSDFRYTIGGLLMKKIYEMEGVTGLIEALHVEGRNDILKNQKSNDGFFQYLEKKLGVKEDDFAKYVKEELLLLPGH